jgi:hypothetical protein
MRLPSTTPEKRGFSHPTFRSIYTKDEKRLKQNLKCVMAVLQGVHAAQ